MDGFFPDPGAGGPYGDDSESKGSDGRGYGGDSKEDQKDNDGSGDRSEQEDWLKRMSNRELAYFQAGIVGVDPRPFTLRTISWMSHGKERSDWNKFATVAAHIHNANCTKKSELIDFRDIHPSYLSEAIAKKKAGPSDEEVAKGQVVLKKMLNG